MKNSSARVSSPIRLFFVLAGITAGYFCVAFELGYVDATIVLLALLALVRAVRRPQRVHLATAVLLMLVTGILLWANLRPTRWQEEFGVDTPVELDPITEAMFWRGWPLSPCMVCLVHGMMFHPCGVQWALVLDAVLFVAALLTVKAVCERCLRWRDTKMRACGASESSGSVEGVVEQISDDAKG